MCHYFSSSFLLTITNITLHNIKTFIAEDEASTDSGDAVDDDHGELSDRNDYGRYWRGMALYHQGTQVGRYRANQNAKTDHRVKVVL